MVKYFKINIQREHPEEGRTHYTYPKEYDPKKIQVLAYESTGCESDVTKRGDTEEYLIGAVADADAEIFSKIGEELTEEEITTLGNKWTKQVEKITDQETVLKICAKAALGETLTDEEKAVINPDNETKGINKSKSFSAGLQDIKTHFAKVEAQTKTEK